VSIKLLRRHIFILIDIFPRVFDAIFDIFPRSYGSTWKSHKIFCMIWLTFFVRFMYNITKKKHNIMQGGFIMIVTATEFKLNLGKYLELAANQDVFITKNGKNIARLTSPSIDKLSVLNDLVGIISPQEEIDEDNIREERLTRQ